MSVTEVHITEPGASSSGDRSDSAAPVLSIATLLNDRQRYERMRRSLANSLELQTIQWLPIEADRLGLGATEALNHCLAEARAEWIVCAHQDVVFPHDWWRRARAQIAAWEHRTSRIVGVTGLVGVTRHGRFRGSITDPAGFGRWGPLPDRVLSVDEHVLLVRRATRLRFDPETPGFHCYGTDIALRALRDGFDVIAIDAPVSHFSTGTIDDTYRACAAWLLAKWGDQCGHAIPTCAATIGRHAIAAAPRRLLLHVNRRLSVWQRRLRIGAPVGPGSPADVPDIPRRAA